MTKTKTKTEIEINNTIYSNVLNELNCIFNEEIFDEEILLEIIPEKMTPIEVIMALYLNEELDDYLIVIQDIIDDNIKYIITDDIDDNIDDEIITKLFTSFLKKLAKHNKINECDKLFSKVEQQF